jgi:hypothetical protein
MVEANNGHSERAKRHNAKLCPFAIRERIINALANGDSIRSIARKLQVSNNTVVAIREEDWQQVAARKERIAAQSELIATEAADKTLEAIRSGEIKGQGLIPAFGVAVDKMLALRGDSALNIPHRLSLTFQITDDDMIAYMVALSHANEEQRQRLKSIGLDGFAWRAQQIRASQGESIQRAVIEAEIVQETRLLAEKTQRKRAG